MSVTGLTPRAAFSVPTCHPDLSPCQLVTTGIQVCSGVRAALRKLCASVTKGELGCTAQKPLLEAKWRVRGAWDTYQRACKGLFLLCIPNAKHHPARKCKEKTARPLHRPVLQGLLGESWRHLFLKPAEQALQNPRALHTWALRGRCLRP